MSASIKIAQWVQKKPMILIHFDEAFSESLHNSRQGFEHLTIVKPHSVLQDFKLPTLCVLEIQEQGAARCYVGTHSAETKSLATIIDAVAKGNKAVVLAWHKKVQASNL